MTGPVVQRDWAEVRCSLCIFSPSTSPKALTELVGITPTYSRRKGEPRNPGAPGSTVVTNIWVWKAPEDIEAQMNSQLDAIWRAHSTKAKAFRELPPDASVTLSIEIYHHTDLSLGWSLDKRHVAMMAAFNASMDIDEYDYTDLEAE